MTWLLLIYTVPAQPTRLRAAVWRDLKRAGAVYLRDGVCVLPERDEAAAIFSDLASKVQSFGGQATVARSVQLDDERSEAILAGSRAARADEYADLEQELEAFLAHLQLERRHHHFSYSELEQLEADVGKLQQWSSQIRSRDFEPANIDVKFGELLKRCEEEIEAIVQETAVREEAPR